MFIIQEKKITMNKYCFIVPIYNHHHKLEELFMALNKYSFSIVLVDDGSHEECKQVIANVISKYKDSYLKTLELNSGKGAAVMAGLQFAYEKGYSHGIQIDADFQHDVTDIEKFIHLSNENSGALICGIPSYDESVPKKRLYPRYITHFWVWVHTLSFAIKDSMCGYRCYPLATTQQLMSNVRLSKRMNFDIEIIVRLSWMGVNIINQPTKVVYHDEIPSNFRMFKDNLGITMTHTKLFFGMLIRIPMLIKRKING